MAAIIRSMRRIALICFFLIPFAAMSQPERFQPSLFSADAAALKGKKGDILVFQKNQNVPIISFNLRRPHGRP